MFAESKSEHLSAKRQALSLRSFRRAADMRDKPCVARSTKLFVSCGGLVHRIPNEFPLSNPILAESSPKPVSIEVEPSAAIGSGRGQET